MSATTMPGEDGIRRLYDRIDGPNGLVERISEAEHKVDKHEALCAERYKGIDSRLQLMQWLMLGMLAATLFEPRLLVQAVLKQWGMEVSSPAPAVVPPKVSGG